MVMSSSSLFNININTMAAKDIVAYWRQQLKPDMGRYTGDFAFGGLHGRGTDLAAMVS